MTPPSKRVLIIEDDPDAGHFVVQLVERAGLAKTSLYPDGLDGLSACFQSPPDALVLDLNLPTLRGEEILRMIRTSKELRALPILVVSSLPEAKRKEFELLQMGADAYLDKPLLERTFVHTLADLLDRGSIRAAEAESEDRRPISHDFIVEALQRELGAQEVDVRRVVENPLTAETITQTPADRRASSVPSSSGGGGGKPATKPAESAITPSGIPDEVYSGYRILGVIGSGGMGTVYRAEQVRLHRTVALKILLANYHENSEMRERFHREALIMAQVNHPNIVQIYETGKTEFSSFFSMEYVDGDSLATRIRKSSLNWEECPNIIRQTCNAVAHLHSVGIIHRDVKPSNILISQQGLVKITDFGISQARLDMDHEQFTEVPQFMGTPDYMAPELRRTAEASEKTDLYALGMTFWRMFAGQGAMPLGAPLNRIHPEIPQGLAEVIAKCIEYDPEKRFKTVLEARDAILEACKESFSGTWEQYISPII